MFYFIWSEIDELQVSLDNTENRIKFLITHLAYFGKNCLELIWRNYSY